MSGVILFLSAVITSSWDPVTRLGLSTRKVGAEKNLTINLLEKLKGLPFAIKM